MRTVHNSVDHNFINCVQEQLYNIYIKKERKLVCNQYHYDQRSLSFRKIVGEEKNYI